MNIDAARWYQKIIVALEVLREIFTGCSQQPGEIIRNKKCY